MVGAFYTTSSAYLGVGKQLCLPVVFSLVWGTACSVSIQPSVYVETLVSTFILLALCPCAVFLSDLRTALSLPLCYHSAREGKIFNFAVWLLGDLYILSGGSSSTWSLTGEV